MNLLYEARAVKLCLAKVTGPSLLYMTVGLRVHG